MNTSHTSSRHCPENLIHTLLTLAIYLLSLSIYLHPLIVSPTPSESPLPTTKRWNLIARPRPQLDEIHILDPDNRDVSPPASCDGEKGAPCPSWKDAWHNDYWGRPLDFPSSHKSWRPVSVWSFRFLKGGARGRRILGWIGRAFASAVDGVSSVLRPGESDASPPLAAAEDDLPASELFVHRLVNVWIHACIVQLIGVASTLLFPPAPDDPRSSRTVACARHFSRLLFALHPAHVEAVANAANRPHLLGLLFNAVLVDPSFPLAGAALSSAMGLLSAETALFQLPAVLVTMTAVRYGEFVAKRRRREATKDPDDDPDDEDEGDLRRTLVSLLPRYALLLLTNALYLLYRHLHDTLSIPPGLIRPAENPYYNKVGTTWSTPRRIMNYSYVTALHVFKSWGVEIVGFSHEYGYDCVPEMRASEDGADWRLALPIGLSLAFVGSTVGCWYGRGIGGGTPASAAAAAASSSHSSRRNVLRRAQDRTMRMLLLSVFLSWMATLFPIAGVLKVGTFVADRIVVPSTFGACIFGGRLLALWIAEREPNESDHVDTSRFRRRSTTKRVVKTIVVFEVLAQHLARRTHRRVAEWMDSVPLLESSVRSCPRSIKSNLEMSKLYSGLVPHMVDFEKALRLIETAQQIDPTYCDVHLQFGLVYFQQGKYIEFEEEMVEALLCPFTMGQAMGNWKKYWNAVLAPRNGKTDAAARTRYDEYMKIMEESIEREAEKARRDARERRIRDGSSNLEDEL